MSRAVLAPEGDTYRIKVVPTEGRKLSDIARDLCRVLGEHPATWHLADKYVGPWNWEGDHLWPEHYRWIACYAVRGDSEAHYVHVDALVSRDSRWERRMLFLGKTFDGQEAAYRLAAVLAEALDA